MRKYNVAIDGRGMYASELVEEILKVRDIHYSKDVFLKPPNFISPPGSLPNVDKAYKILNHNVVFGRKIGVLFDVDTDGICAGSIMTMHLEDIGVEPKIYINHGKAHGLIKEESYWEEVKKLDLLIIVDSLNSDYSVYDELHKYHTDIIVLDHHDIKQKDPESIVLVSSQRGYSNTELSGAGVTWQFCRYIDEQNGTHYADKYVSLAAIGIVADDMNMAEIENRAIVYEGLQKYQEIPAIKKIIGSYAFNCTAILYSIAPLINATNRMNKNEVAMKVFLTKDEKELRKIIKELKACKTEQDDKIAELMSEACRQCDIWSDEYSVLMVYLENVQGLSGLLAQKLVSIYHRPVIVMGSQEENNGIIFNRGSIRSPYNINFAKLVNDTKYARADGHPEAAGFLIREDDWLIFLDIIDEAVKKKIPTIDMRPQADVYVETCDLGIDLCNKMADMDLISGEGFKPIRFLLKNLHIDAVDGMKDGLHLKLTSDNVDFIKWNTDMSVEECEQYWLEGKTFDAIGTLSLSSFGTTKVQVICDEIFINEEGE